MAGNKNSRKQNGKKSKDDQKKSDNKRPRFIDPEPIFRRTKAITDHWKRIITTFVSKPISYQVSSRAIFGIVASISLVAVFIIICKNNSFVTVPNDSSIGTEVIVTTTVSESLTTSTIASKRSTATVTTTITLESITASTIESEPITTSAIESEPIITSAIESEPIITSAITTTESKTLFSTTATSFNPVSTTSSTTTPYKEIFNLHLDDYGHQVYETESPITDVSISDPSVALCIVPESKDYLNIQALNNGNCEIIVKLSNGDIYLVNLTVGNVKT